MGLREIARCKNTTLRSLITQIDDAREKKQSIVCHPSICA
ncbi:MAG TPA: hypothetical protein VFN84_08735 [Pseudolabrys sp.]|nr:hypothetical protein [Pseudolabrys sp.]